jgi:hypothetical protein
LSVSKLEVMFYVNVLCAYVVLNIVCSICTKEDNRNKDNEGVQKKSNGERVEW